MKYRFWLSREKLIDAIQDLIIDEKGATTSSAMQIEKLLYNLTKDQRPKPMKAATKKKESDLDKYSRAKREFWSNHSGLCERDGCAEVATEVHHFYQYRVGPALYDKSQFIGLCSDCHEVTHRAPSIGIEWGVMATKEEKARYKSKMSRWK